MAPGQAFDVIVVGVVISFVATGGKSGAAGASDFVVGFVAGGGGVAGAGFDDSVS